MENNPIPAEPTSEKAGSMGKFLLAGVFVLLLPIVFFWTNQHAETAGNPTSETGFVLKMDKENRIYYGYETPIFEVKNAQTKQNFVLQLTRDGKAFPINLPTITTDETGHAYFRTGLTSDDNIGKWQATITAGSEKHSIDFEVRSGCSDDKDVTITTDAKTYKDGDKVSYTVHGPVGSQIHWFGLVNRDQKVVSLNENQAYYGDLINQNGEWKSKDIVAKAEGTSSDINTIISICDRTANATYKVSK